MWYTCAPAVIAVDLSASITDAHAPTGVLMHQVSFSAPWRNSFQIELEAAFGWPHVATAGWIESLENTIKEQGEGAWHYWMHRPPEQMIIAFLLIPMLKAYPLGRSMLQFESDLYRLLRQLNTNPSDTGLVAKIREKLNQYGTTVEEVRSKAITFSGGNT